MPAIWHDSFVINCAFPGVSLLIQAIESSDIASVIYLLNHGANRLLENQGDGRFLGATIGSGIVGMKRSAAEFMQYLCPVGGGPSLKRWPRCESAYLLRTSVRGRKRLKSFFSTIFSATSGRVKLGQPVPESNLSAELNRGSPVTMST